MNAPAAIADSRLRQADMRLSAMPAGRLAPRGLNVLLQVRIGLAGLRVPVSPGDCRVPVALPDATGATRRTVMNYAG